MKKILNLENGVALIATGLFFCAMLLPYWHPPRHATDRFVRIANALENYAVDNGGNYPPHSPQFQAPGYSLPNILTTPIPYLAASELLDPLSTSEGLLHRYRYINIDDGYTSSTSKNQLLAAYGAWLVISPGYDKVYGNFNSYTPFTIYDATNGTLSGGDILRSQRMTSEVGIKD